MFNVLYPFLIVFLAHGCRESEISGCPAYGYDKRLKIWNMSMDTLTMHVNFQDSTLSIYNGRPYFELPDFFIEPSANKPLLQKNCWEYGFRRGDGILYIYLFDVTMLRSKDWEQIVADQNYLKRYKFTLQELKGMNWQIVYQP